MKSEFKEILKHRLGNSINIVFMDELEDDFEIQNVNDLEQKSAIVKARVTPENVTDLKMFGIDIYLNIKSTLFEESACYIMREVIKTLDEHNGFNNNSESISDLCKYASDHDYNSFVCSSGTATAIQESSIFKAESNSESNYPMAIYNVGSISDNSKNINIFVNPTMTWDNSTIYFAHENKLSTIYIDDISFDNLDDYYTQLTIKFRIK